LYRSKLLLVKQRAPSSDDIAMASWFQNSWVMEEHLVCPTWQPSFQSRCSQDTVSEENIQLLLPVFPAGVILSVLVIHTITVLTSLLTGLVLNPLKDDLR
jgi:hypothetical protein